MKNRIVTKKFDNSKYNQMEDDDDMMSSNEQSHALDALFAEQASSSKKGLTVGNRVKCELVAIGDKEAFLSIMSGTGRPRDGVLSKSEILDNEGKLKHKSGDVLELYITQTKGALISLSTSPLAKSMAEDLLDAYKSALPIEGKIIEVCNGGVRVSIQGKTAFCPISQIDIAHVTKAEDYIGQKYSFLITELSEGGRNIIVSRRKLLQNERALSEKVFIKEKREGDIVDGQVKRLEAFGAFVEIAPGIEGLVHISEISWSRINKPHEALNIGQIVKAKILKNEMKEGKLKISLSIKQAETEPWSNLSNLFKEGQVVSGKVLRCLHFGAFVEISHGIEGLVPLSEMSYTKRVVRSDELFKEGDKILVMIKEIHPENKRILLSLKDAGTDPWALINEKFPLGSIVSGKVTRREPYGVFIELEEGIVGLLPKSSTHENPDFHYDKIKLTDVITVQVSEINQEERRISLSPPQDPDKDSWKQHIEKSSSKESPKKEFGSTLASKFKGLKA